MQQAQSGMTGDRRRSYDAGFSLAETMIAVGLLATAALGIAQLTAVSIRANLSARGQTSAMLLAGQRIEQLRGLTWGFDPAGTGLPASDTTTDLSQEPPTATGRGLRPSPPETLRHNVHGYHDFIDGAGARIGTGGTPPPGTAYIRRWSVEPVPANPNDTLVLQVQVTPIDRDGATADTGRLRGTVRLVSVKTRKAP
jgi:hypothetical protein